MHTRIKHGQKIKLWPATILNIPAMLAAILKKQVHELGANVEKILYAKNPVEIQKIKLWSAAILNMAAMLAAILKIQIHELGASVEKILYAKNPVEIRKI